MKTTIEISDTIFRQVKATASLKGQTLKSFFLEALREKLSKETRKKTKHSGWRRTFGQASSESVTQVQTIIDEEFSKINPEDWK